MSQQYSDPTREADEHALPDLEVWSVTITILRTDCGEYEVPRQSEAARGFCPDCGKATCVHSLDTFDDDARGILHTDKVGYFYWFCFPGCLPDSEPIGPFASEDEALQDARAGS